MYFSDESKLVLSLLDKFGALTIAQAKKIFEGSGFNPKPMIAWLCKYRMIQFFDDNFITLQNNFQFDQETLYCLWVMLDRIKAEDISKSNDLRTANKCDNGAEICYINNNKTMEYITFVSTSTFTKISLIQDTFYTSTGVTAGNEESSMRNYIFVSDDEAILDELEKMNLTLPFMVAIVNADLMDPDASPSIDYYAL